MRFLSPRILPVVAAGMLLGVWACGSGGLMLPADAAGTELFEQAEQFVADQKWRDAATAYDTLLRNYPTSPHLPEARLGLGRSYYEQNRTDTLLLSIDAFKNFMTYHPSHFQVDYSQLMVAMGYMRLMRSPDRDQQYTREALEEFEAFLEDYPESPYRDLAYENMQTVIDTLAAHELQVAEFQMGRGRYIAARRRCEFALRKYPTTTHRCEILYTLAESLRMEGDPSRAADYYQQVLTEHPDCRFAADARKRLNKGGAAGAPE